MLSMNCSSIYSTSSIEAHMDSSTRSTTETKGVQPMGEPIRSATGTYDRANKERDWNIYLGDLS